MSDGASVYANAVAPGTWIDLVHGGQGVFGIAVGAVWREVESDLAALPRNARTAALRWWTTNCPAAVPARLDNSYVLATSSVPDSRDLEQILMSSASTVSTRSSMR